MTGQVAIVAGGTGALGQAVTRRFLEAGATLWVPYRGPEALRALQERLPAELRARLHAQPADVTDETAFASLVRRALEAHGRVDVLVNAVGGFAPGDLLATPPDQWHRLLALNLTSAVAGCRAVLPAMLAARRGRIVNVASRAVLPPQGGFTAYTVAKAGVIALTQALAQEVRPHGVTVNAVLPGTMDTPANRRAMPDAERSGWVSPEAVAGVIACLASEAAGAVTGALIPV